MSEQDNWITLGRKKVMEVKETTICVFAGSEETEAHECQPTWPYHTRLNTVVTPRCSRWGLKLRFLNNKRWHDLRPMLYRKQIINRALHSSNWARSWKMKWSHFLEWFHNIPLHNKTFWNSYFILLQWFLNEDIWLLRRL